MRQSKTTGNITLRAGTGGAVPDSATCIAFGSRHYCAKARATWRDTGVPHAPVLPDLDFLWSWHPVDQRPRNVCVGFAMAAAVEMLRHNRTGKPVEPVSAQAIYWMMRKEFPLTGDDAPPGYEIGATRLKQAQDVVEQRGVCPDSLAPFYLGMIDRDTAPHGTAPSQEALEAMNPDEFGEGVYGFHPEADRPATSLTRTFHELLAQGRPVAAGFPMFGTSSGRSNWHSVDALSTGEVLGPLDAGSGIQAGTVADSGHVVCLVGYAPDPEAEGEGWFIFRNSWGVDFAQDGNPRFPDLPPGYGTLSASYVDHYCWEYYAPELAGAPVS